MICCVKRWRCVETAPWWDWVRWDERRLVVVVGVVVVVVAVVILEVAWVGDDLRWAWSSSKSDVRMATPV